MNPEFYKLILITQKQNQPINSYLEKLKLAVLNGVTAIQVREKSLDYQEIIKFTKYLIEYFRPFNIPIIINDSLEIAKIVNADGLHLGQDDGNILEARKQLGKNKIIGLTVNSYDEIEQANKLPIDYIGIGAIFKTTNKNNVKKIWGCSGLKLAAKTSKHKVIAIGGINPENIEKVIKSGANGVAAINAFHNKDLAIDKSTKKMLQIINNI